jgi:hypothetical protein
LIVLPDACPWPAKPSSEYSSCSPDKVCEREGSVPVL